MFSIFIHFLSEQYLKGIQSIASVFLHMARTLDHDNNDQQVDRGTFHHWITQPLVTNLTTPQCCLCGLVTSNQNTKWYMTEELCGTQRDTDVHISSIGDVKEFENVVLDVMCMKVNGIKTAFETANTILRVKHFVKEIFE